MSGCSPARSLLVSLYLASTLPFASGCSQMMRVAAGPAAAYPDDGAPSYGGELRVRRGSGESDAEEAALLEVGGRLLVTERTQAIGAGMGGAYLHWLGPSAVTASIMPGLGVERFREKAFMNFSLHAALGTGLVLKESIGRDDRWHLFMPPEMTLPMPQRISLKRKRVVLTLDFTGSIDARTTRQPLYGVGILVGIAWIVERYDVDAPEPADPKHPFLFP